MKRSPYYLSPTGMAYVKAAAQRMGQRLRELRAEREADAVLAKAAMPALPKFVI